MGVDGVDPRHTHWHPVHAVGVCRVQVDAESDPNVAMLTPADLGDGEGREVDLLGDPVGRRQLEDSGLRAAGRTPSDSSPTGSERLVMKLGRRDQDPNCISVARSLDG